MFSAWANLGVTFARCCGYDPEPIEAYSLRFGRLMRRVMTYQRLPALDFGPDARALCADLLALYALFECRELLKSRTVQVC